MTKKDKEDLANKISKFLTPIIEPALKDKKDFDIENFDEQVEEFLKNDLSYSELIFLAKRDITSTTEKFLSQGLKELMALSGILKFLNNLKQ